MIMKIAASLLALGFMDASGCGLQPTADQVETHNQEAMEIQSNSQIGLPNIVNFREKRTLKLVEELADQAVPTYSYVFNAFQGCFVYVGPTFGYPIPYATQYTSPSKLVDGDDTDASTTNFADHPTAVPQADPNGLFKPAEAAGTWILMRDPASGNLTPQYIEDNVDTFTYRVSAECGHKSP